MLVFRHVDHPEAGLQVPAGTVEPDESPENALMRELREEANITDVAAMRELGCFAYDMCEHGRAEIQTRYVFQVTPGAGYPETWDHLETHAPDGSHLFRFEWLSLYSPKLQLAAGQGNLLGLIEP